jgi:hypothetical protein
LRCCLPIARPGVENTGSKIRCRDRAVRDFGGGNGIGRQAVGAYASILDAVGFHRIRHAHHLLSRRQRQGGSYLNLQPEITVELVRRSSTGAQENGEGSMAHGDRVDSLAPLLRAANHSGMQREAIRIDAVSHRSAVGFRETSLKIHELQNRLYLSEYTSCTHQKQTSQ